MILGEAADFACGFVSHNMKSVASTRKSGLLLWLCGIHLCFLLVGCTSFRFFLVFLTSLFASQFAMNLTRLFSFWKTFIARFNFPINFFNVIFICSFLNEIMIIIFSICFLIFSYFKFVDIFCYHIIGIKHSSIWLLINLYMEI